MKLPPASHIHPANDWEEPILLGRSPLPVFPVETLPQVVRDFVGALAAELEVPPDLPAIAVVGVLAGAVARKVAVQVQRGWEEPLMLYLAVALPPGNLKSTAFKKAVKPLLEAERRASEGMQLEVQLNASKKKGWHRAIEELEQKMGRTGENIEGLHQNIAELHKKLANVGRDTLPRYFCEDVTAEKLAELMANNNGRMVLMSSEGGGPMQMMTGRYCRPGQANIEIYLKGHSGDDLTIDRKNSLPVHVRNLSLTMVLTVQPSVLKGLTKNPDLDERGVLPRFLFSLPRSLVGERTLLNCPAPQGAVDAYAKVVQRLCALEAKDASACAEQPHHLLAMTPEARQVFLVFRHRLEIDLSPQGRLAPVGGFGAKLAGTAARLAGLLHLAESVGERDVLACPIEAKTVSQAIVLVDYFIAHGLAAYDLMAEPAATKGAQKAIAWFEREAKTTFTRRALHQAVKGSYPRVQDLEPILELLKDHGYIRSAAVVRTNQRGRKPVYYEVHPRVLLAGKDSAIP